MRRTLLQFCGLLLCAVMVAPCCADDTLDVKKAVKAYLDAAEQGDAKAFTNHWTADGKKVHGRTESPDKYDVVLEGDKLALFWEVTAEKGESKTTYSEVTVKIDGSDAELRLKLKYLREKRDFESFAELYRVTKTAAGWKIVASRTWPLESRLNGETLKYTERTLAEIDEQASDARRIRNGLLGQGGEPLGRATRAAMIALIKAYRQHEAHALAKDLTTGNVPASSWKLRAQLALFAGDPEDSLASYRKLLELDPKAEVPAAMRTKIDKK